MAATAGTLALLLIAAAFFCGCLQVEPEELPPLTATQIAEVTASPAVPAGIPENSGLISPPIDITTPKKARLYSEMDFPPEVNAAISDYTGGKTTDTINGFLRWDSVRSRTSKAEAARISGLVHAIDYAMVNTTLQEDIRLYTGISGEQVKRVRNDSAFSENGYLVASYDPSVIFHRLSNSGRDTQGYLTMCVFDFRKGDHILLVNATEREFLIPRGGTWDVTGMDTYEQLAYSADSIPRYDDIIQTKVRFIRTAEHF
jgi:hypothetical protein